MKTVITKHIKQNSWHMTNADKDITAHYVR